MKSIGLTLLLCFSVANTYAFIGFKIPRKKDSMRKIGQTTQTALDHQNIPVLVWNIYKGNRKSFTKDFAALAKDKSLILLQETIDTPDVIGALKKLDQYEHHLITSFIFGDDKNRTGVSVSSNVQALSVSFQRSRGREYTLFTPKTLSISKYRFNDKSKKDLLIINIHSLNQVFAQVHINQIKRVESEIKKHDGPIMFAGDFNTNSIKKMENMRRFMSKHKLEEVIFKDGDRRLRVTEDRLILDHIYVRGLGYRNAHIPYKYSGSDHKAMVANFYVK